MKEVFFVVALFTYKKSFITNFASLAMPITVINILSALMTISPSTTSDLIE